MPYKDKAQQAEAARRWREANRELIRQRYAERYGPAGRAHARERYAADPELFKGRSRRRWVEKREVVRAEQRRYYGRNRDTILLKVAAWHAAHPLNKTVSGANGRARRHGIVDRLTVAQWRAVLDASGGHCTYCGEARALSLDHVVPMSRGGSNLAANITAACLPCNGGKRERTGDEWREYLRRRREREAVAV